MMIEALNGPDADAVESTLPEPLGFDAFRLGLMDFAAALILTAAAYPIGASRATGLATFTMLFVGFALGRYRVSFAVTRNDEWYSAVSVALASGVVLLILIPAFQVSFLAAGISLVLFAAASGAAATYLTAQRRNGRPSLRATHSRALPVSHRRINNPLVRSTIAALDLILSALLILILWPVMALCWWAIVSDDGAPALFLQRRTSLDGDEFMMYKFRTMRVDADGRWATAENDDRVTRVGRFLRRTSLDELPQLFNVLRGEMSLVGPRPEMCEYAHRFTSVMPTYQARHLVRPGITGWAQIHHDRSFPPSEFAVVLEYDLFYIENYSISLYLFCLVKTACEVMAHRAV